MLLWLEGHADIKGKYGVRNTSKRNSTNLGQEKRKNKFAESPTK